jgi:uncharacterized protein (DUF1697 family)
MATYVALLRGINLGKHNRIAMADLRALLTELGYGDVRTHLQSGNALFTAADAKPEKYARQIEKGIDRTFGFDVPTVVRTVDELRAVVARNPFGEIATNPSRSMVGFLDAAPDRERVAKLDPDAFEPERFHLEGREVYFWCPKGLQKSRVVNALSEKVLGTTMTLRNWNTVTKLVTLGDD